MSPLTLAVDHTRQRPEGFTQVVAGVAPTLRPANRQYPKIAADLGYTPPSFNAFDRLTDVDTPLRSHQDLGRRRGHARLEARSRPADLDDGLALLGLEPVKRSRLHRPASDDGVGGTVAAAAMDAGGALRRRSSRNLNLVAGVFAFQQSLVSDPSFKQEQGSAAARFLLAPTPAAATPGLLDGYGFDQYVDFGNVSAAVFAQLTWSVTDRLRLLPGLRLNYDQKDVDFDQQVYGGLQTSDPALIALQRSIFAPQAYTADVDDTNLSGQLTAAYRVSDRVHTYATYATGFKSVGLNLNGLPADALGRPILSTAVVKPEDERHVEVGIKTQPFQGVTANLTAFNTTIKDFQAQVVNADVGVLRGYLANAEKVRVRGAEFDGQARIGRRGALYAAVAYTDGIYVSFPDAPPPLEDTGGPQVKDISGSVLPGISKWAWSLGGEYANPATVAGKSGELFGGLDLSYRTEFSSSSSASRYLVAPAYSLLNARAGFRWSGDWALYVWSRNLLDEQYYELLTAAPGNTGLFVGQPGEGRAIGVTLRAGVRWPGK